MIALDTNILVYADSMGAKADLARSIVDRAALVDCVMPMQVLAEFANVCRKKAFVPTEVLERRLTAFSELFKIVSTDIDHVRTAVKIAARYQLAYFDALICTVVRGAGATVLLSEDMHDGLALGGLTVVNPFADANQTRIDILLTP